MFNFSLFKSSKEETPAATWNPNTLTMEQPSSPEAPHAQQQVVTEQPVRPFIQCSVFMRDKY